MAPPSTLGPQKRALARLEAVAAHCAGDDAPNGIISSSPTASRSERLVYRTELNPLNFLERSSRIFPGKQAVFVPKVDDEHPSRSFTYKDFGERARKLASRLMREGIGKDSRVGYLVPNTVAGLEAHYSVALAGGIVVMMNTRLKPSEVVYILNHSKSSIFFVDHELAGPFLELFAKNRAELPNLKTMIVVRDVSDPAVDEYEAWVASGELRPWAEYPGMNLEDERDTITICYTSGTTGKPKGVMYHYRGAYLNALGQVIETSMNPKSKYMWTLPMFHCNGWTFPWAVTAASATHVTLRKIDYDVIWDLLKNHGVTHYCGAPTVQTFLIANPNKVKLQNGVKVMVAGSPPSPTLIAQMTELNLLPIHVYGLTEVYGPTSICVPQEQWDSLDAAQKSEMVSRQGVNNIVSDGMRIVDPETMLDVAADGKTMGEILMRGNITMTGYLDDPKATEKAFKGGWFHSGDLAVMHPDGYIEIRDRDKDVIISGAENISSVEVENCIMAHSKVLECCVVAAPDDVWGERPVAYVVLKPSAIEHGVPEPGELERDIIEFCRKRLANFKCPSRVMLEMELPKTGTGKIQKFVLREKLWANKKKAGKYVN
ncbi:AMP-dependent synthetase and ligase [Hyaloraphidium curvatum]|nr:AMP-dependent synthetase and ligase [Hyaloraphidium curvatum]